MESARKPAFMPRFTPSRPSDHTNAALQQPPPPRYLSNGTTAPSESYRDQQDTDLHNYTHNALDMPSYIQPSRGGRRANHTAPPPTRYTGVIDPALLQGQSASAGTPTSAPTAATRSAYTPAPAPIVSSSSAPANVGFSDRAFWTSHMSILQPDGQRLGGTYEQMLQRYPACSSFIFQNFGIWRFNQPLQTLSTQDTFLSSINGQSLNSHSAHGNALTEEDPMTAFTTLNDPPPPSASVDPTAEGYGLPLSAASPDSGEYIGARTGYNGGAVQKADEGFQKVSREGDIELTDCGRLPEPAVNDAIILENGILLTTCTISNLHNINAPRTGKIPYASAERVATMQEQELALAENDSLGGSQTDRNVTKTANHDGENVGAATSQASALQFLAVPDVTMYQSLEVDGEDDWDIEATKTAQMSREFFDALEVDFDRNPAAPKMKTDAKACYIEKQDKAVSELNEILTTEIGLATTKQNCDKLAEFIVLTNRIGVPKAVHAKAKSVANLICSERAAAVKAAIEANKRIAIDVAKGQHLEKFVCDPAYAVIVKINGMKSNFRRDTNIATGKPEREAMKAAVAMADGSRTQVDSPANTPPKAKKDDQQKAPVRKRKAKQEAVVDGEGKVDEQREVKKPKVKSRKQSTKVDKTGMEEEEAT